MYRNFHEVTSSLYRGGLECHRFKRRKMGEHCGIRTPTTPVKKGAEQPGDEICSHPTVLSLAQGLQVLQKFLEVLHENKGSVFVHCRLGDGLTEEMMVAAYR